MIDYARHLQSSKPTQFDKTHAAQVPNSCGAYVFSVGPFERLERFLILGAEGGTYYASEKQLTRENAASLTLCLDTDPARAVRTIFEISQWGRAPKQGPGIFALAIAASHKNPEARRAALQALPHVCRTARSLLEFVAYVDGLRGWGAGLRRAVGRWYTGQKFEDLSYQVIKYRGSGKESKRWTHRDVLRLAHPKPEGLDGNVRAVLRWLVGGEMGERHVERRGRDKEWQATVGDLPERLAAFERLQASTDVAEVVSLIDQYNYTHEMVPSQFKNERRVWEALLQRMPLGALVRNLGKLSSLGILDQTRSEAATAICQRLIDIAAIRKGRLHPIAFLSAQMVYRSGHGVRGKLTWSANRSVTEALESAFYLAFGNVKSTGQRLALCLDVSGSMQSGSIAGIPGLTPAMATAAMALVTMRTEPKALCMGFSHRFEQLCITSDMSLELAMKATSELNFGATDCALPFRWALKAGVHGPLAIDGFAVYTDHETNQSTGHPDAELRNYREKTGIPARLAVAAFTSNGFTIANPDDGGMLDVVGFDASAPSVIADFFRGKGPDKEPTAEPSSDTDTDEAEAA